MNMTTGKPRLEKRLRNFSTGKPIVLTKRDKDLLADIDRFDVLTTEQISALHFRTLARTRKRMRKLWLHGFVKRWTQPVRMGGGSLQFLFAVTPLARLMIGSTNCHRIRQYANQHRLDINSFRICVEVALRKMPAVTLTSWIQDRTKVIAPPSPWDVTERVVIADAHFTLTLNGKRFSYFVEIDRGTMDLPRLKAKFNTYLFHWRKRRERGELLPPFRVLVITSSEKRVSHILSVLAQLDKHLRRDIIGVIAASRFSLHEPEKLFAPLWSTVDRLGNTHQVSPLPVIQSLKLPTVPSNSLVRGPDAGSR